MKGTEVSKVSLWEIVYFRNWSSAIVVFRQSLIWSKWSPNEVGVGSPTIPVYY